MVFRTPEVALCALLLLAAFAFFPATAVLVTQAAPASASAGERFAQQRCGRCHATGLKGDSPARAAPPFRELGPEPVAMLEAARTSGMIAGHDEMPMFEVTRAQVENLIAYVRQLSRPKR